MPSDYEVLDALVDHALSGPVHPDRERVFRAYQEDRSSETADEMPVDPGESTGPKTGGKTGAKSEKGS